MSARCETCQDQGEIYISGTMGSRGHDMACPDCTQPTDLVTVIQASRFRTELGSPLTPTAIYDAVAAGKLNRYALPVTGARLLVSRAEVAAYQPTGHKPKGYKHEKPLTEGEQDNEHEQR